MKHLELNWEVGFFIDGKNYDDGKERISICAAFCSMPNAVDYIRESVPEETRNNFFIVHQEDFEKAKTINDFEKFQFSDYLYLKII